ncbi:MAG: hypothetical protein PHP01_04305, partial [Phycisphaerae bacterium]|nr:hypothetical protein [Phycisphaerae bacterium]
LLKAQAAIAGDDFVGQLKAYNELTQLLVSKNLAICDVMLAFARLLEKSWLIQEALKIYELISKITTESIDCSSYIHKLTEYSNLVNKSNCFIEPAMPVSALVESSITMDNLFTGKFVIKQVSEPIVIDSQITIEDFIERYEQIRLSENDNLLPAAEQQNCYWLTEDKISNTCVISFARQESGCMSHLQMAVRVENAPHQTVFIPFTYLLTENKGMIPTEQHNSSILSELRNMENQSFSNSGLKAIHKTVYFVVRRLMGRHLADSSYLIGAGL